MWCLNFGVHIQGSDGELGSEIVLRLEQESQTFVFTEVAERPVLSVLRDFSAPVKLEVVGQDTQDLVFLLGHDSDSFSRWEAGQRLQRTLLLKLYDAAKAGGSSKVRWRKSSSLGCLLDAALPLRIVLMETASRENLAYSRRRCDSIIDGHDCAFAY